MADLSSTGNFLHEVAQAASLRRWDYNYFRVIYGRNNQSAQAGRLRYKVKRFPRPADYRALAPLIKKVAN